MQNKDNLDCEMYRSLLFDYVSDNLSKQESAELLLHIKSCPECKRELDEIEKMLDAAAKLPEIEIPSTLKAAVSTELAEVGTEIKAKKRIYKYAVGTFMPIAACAAIAIGIFSGGFYDRVVNTDNIISMEASYNTENPDKEQVIIETDDTEVRKSGGEAESTENAKTPQVVAGKTAGSGTDTKNQNTVINEAQKEEVKQEINEDAKSLAAADNSKIDESSAENAQTEAAASGGGSTSHSDAQAPLMMARMHMDPNTEVTDAEEGFKALDIPQSCVVVTEDPDSFVSGFGLVTEDNCDGDCKIEFELSADRWREFIDYNRQYGAELNAEYSDSPSDFVTVTVIEKTDEEKPDDR